MAVDKQLVGEAVRDLVSDPDPRPKVEALEATFEVSRRHPVKLTGTMAVLNPLLVLRHENPEGWEAVKALIDSKRAMKSLKPAWPAPSRETFADRKPEYQRQLMAERRERSRRAADIENLQRSEREQLIGKARMEFMDHTFAKWAKRRDLYLENITAELGRSLSRPEAATHREAFWKIIDAELDEKEEAVRRELLKPAAQRRKIE